MTFGCASFVIVAVLGLVASSIAAGYWNQSEASYYPSGHNYSRSRASYYPNGQNYGGSGAYYYPSGQNYGRSRTSYYPNGQNYGGSGESYYPSGQNCGGSGASCYPNGQNYGGSGASYYPNGQNCGGSGASCYPNGQNCGGSGVSCYPNGQNSGRSGASYYPSGQNYSRSGTSYPQVQYWDQYGVSYYPGEQYGRNCWCRCAQQSCACQNCDPTPNTSPYMASVGDGERLLTTIPHIPPNYALSLKVLSPSVARFIIREHENLEALLNLADPQSIQYVMDNMYTFPKYLSKLSSRGIKRVLKKVDLLNCDFLEDIEPEYAEIIRDKVPALEHCYF